VPELPPPKVLGERVCDLLDSWSPDDCNGQPTCGCDSTAFGKAAINQKNLDALRAEFTPGGIPKFCGLRVVLKDSCIPGGDPKFAKASITCAPSVPDDPVVIAMCLPKSLTFCEARVTMAHEMVHFQQFCTKVGVARKGLQLGKLLPHAVETPAYEAQCEQHWIQACGERLKQLDVPVKDKAGKVTIKVMDKREFIEFCTKTLRPGSIGKDPKDAAVVATKLAEGCQELRRELKLLP